MDRLLRMMLNLFLKKGINIGIDQLARRGKPASEMSPDDRAQAAAAKQTAKRARQVANLARKLGR